MLRTAYGSELAGKLGNLLQRVCALCVTHGIQIESQEAVHEEGLLRAAAHAQQANERAFAEFEFQDGLRVVFDLVSAANRYVDSASPWQLAKRLLDQSARQVERASACFALRRCLSTLVHTLLAISDLLGPFLPSTAEAIRARLRTTPSLGPPLFPPLREP